MTSSRNKNNKMANFHFFKRPDPPWRSIGRFHYKTTRSQVLSLKVNYTVNCAVNCCNRVLHFLRFWKTCGVYFASKTPKFQYILSWIVWKFVKRPKFGHYEVKFEISFQNQKKIAKKCFLRQSRTEYLELTPIFGRFIRNVVLRKTPFKTD